ncbi:aldo/keto reductase [Actinomadura viridis]|nr:aldo/keto reductase [Actinomadura viridis]
MPRLGLGVARVPDAEAAAAVAAALEMGYRSVDTAKDYGNERGVGAAVRESGIPREQVFVTTKVWNADHGYAPALRAFDAGLERLGLDYVDLYLIHWPVPSRGLFQETWRALERLHADGRVRAIGVSNFEPRHLALLMKEGSVVPAVNQIEMHPRLQQQRLRDVHRRYGIVTEAWSPLAKGGALEHPTLVSLAERHGTTPAAIILRWHLDLGNVVIPKTVTPARMRENLGAASLAPLPPADIDAIGALDAGERIGPHPDTFGDPAGTEPPG